MVSESVAIYLIFLGIIYFIFSMWYFRKTYLLLGEFKFKCWWVCLLLLTIFFLGGYFFAGYSFIAKKEYISHELLVGLIFAFGAIFVFITTYLFNITVKELIKKNKDLIIAQKEIRNQNRNLERKVKERTKDLENAFKKAIKKQKEIKKLKDQFVFIAAHELRSPVSAIRWNLESLKDLSCYKKMPKDGREMFEDAEHANKRLIDLVNDLLDVARIEHGTFKMDIKKVSLPNTIGDAMREIRPMAKMSGVTIRYKKLILPQVLADERKVKQVLINLLSNAIKYNTEKGFVTISTQKEKGQVLVTIADTGLGLTPEDQKKIFDKFFRSERKAVQDKEGTGLGLYITKKMIEKMKGKLESTSGGEGKGTTFTFTLRTK
ncbi:MAG: HAMP domain-containing sensor histidine kinase [Candidatus Magasanikbacteria bacterium]